MWLDTSRSVLLQRRWLERKHGLEESERLGIDAYLMYLVITMPLVMVLSMLIVVLPEGIAAGSEFEMFHDAEVYSVPMRWVLLCVIYGVLPLVAIDLHGFFRTREAFIALQGSGSPQDRLSGLLTYSLHDPIVVIVALVSVVQLLPWVLGPVPYWLGKGLLADRSGLLLTGVTDYLFTMARMVLLVGMACFFACGWQRTRAHTLGPTCRANCSTGHVFCCSLQAMLSWRTYLGFPHQVSI